MASDPRGARGVSSLYGGYWNFDVQDFCYMTNRYFPPKALLDALSANLTTLVGAYPSTNWHVSSLVAGPLGLTGDELVAGNGASAAISSHAAVDFTKQCEIRSICFNEADLITCFGNDYGYESWIKEALKVYADPQDCVVLISSSGSSPNVVEAGRYCREQNMGLVTLTGFSADNPLRKLGQTNLWLNSDSYNIIECTHMIWIMAVCDNLAGA